MEARDTMIEWLLLFFRKRRFIYSRQPTYGVADYLRIQGRVADYLIRVEREISDTVKFDGAVSDWVIKYIPPDYLPIDGRVDEYGVRIVREDTVKVGSLLWIYTVSRKITDELNIRCYIKMYES